jgi:DNA-binding CsgD family transcriptional regulator
MLSGREREVVVHVVRGSLSKQIAGELGISETTIKVHRSNLTRKMKARSLSELTRRRTSLNLCKKHSIEAKKAVVKKPKCRPGHSGNFGRMLD